LHATGSAGELGKGALLEEAALGLAVHELERALVVVELEKLDEGKRRVDVSRLGQRGGFVQPDDRRGASSP
jgi:hypothetical protein